MNLRTDTQIHTYASTHARAHAQTKRTNKQSANHEHKAVLRDGSDRPRHMFDSLQCKLVHFDLGHRRRLIFGMRNTAPCNPGCSSTQSQSTTLLCPVLVKKKPLSISFQYKMSDHLPDHQNQIVMSTNHCSFLRALCQQRLALFALRF